MSRYGESYVEKSIGEISSSDGLVRLNARIYRTDPFIVDDGSGKAHVRSTCAFKELDKVRIIGYVSFNKNEGIIEIEPIAVRVINEFDSDLYHEMQLVRKQMNTSRRYEK